MVSNNFLDFIRLRICIYATFLAAIGYLIFNVMGTNIFLVMLSVFFGTGATYAFNNMTDVEEDMINRKKPNSPPSKSTGYAVILLFLSLSLILASLLSVSSLFFMGIPIVAGILYSHLRLKKYTLLKNLYTGFGATFVFLMGASAAGAVSNETFLYYLIFSFFIFISSIISDMRDYKGDGISGIRTIPVKIGYENSRFVVQVLLAAFSVLTLLSPELIVLLPFTLLMLFSIKRGNPGRAHSLGGFSLIFLAVWVSIS